VQRWQRISSHFGNSVNPYRLEGQKTAAFEIVEALGDAPDWLCIPVGNAGNIRLTGWDFASTTEQGYVIACRA